MVRGRVPGAHAKRHWRAFSASNKDRAASQSLYSFFRRQFQANGGECSNSTLGELDEHMHVAVTATTR